MRCPDCGSMYCSGYCGEKGLRHDPYATQNRHLGGSWRYLNGPSFGPAAKVSPWGTVYSIDPQLRHIDGGRIDPFGTIRDPFGISTGLRAEVDRIIRPIR